MKKKLYTLFLSVFLGAGALAGNTAYAQEAEQPEGVPVSEADAAEADESGGSGLKVSTGRMMANEDGKFVDGIMATNNPDRVNGATVNAPQIDVNYLPSSYTIKYRSGIRDQGDYGVCWTFATNTCLETNYLKKGMEQMIHIPQQMTGLMKADTTICLYVLLQQTEQWLQSLLIHLIQARQ